MSMRLQVAALGSDQICRELRHRHQRFAASDATRVELCWKLVTGPEAGITWWSLSQMKCQSQEIHTFLLLESHSIQLSSSLLLKICRDATWRQQQPQSPLGILVSGAARTWGKGRGGVRERESLLITVIKSLVPAVSWSVFPLKSRDKTATTPCP